MAPSKPHARSKPITEFKIPSVCTPMDIKTWESMKAPRITYSMPEQKVYEHPSGGQYTRYRVEVYFIEGKKSTGYLPIPLLYRQVWVDLCYSVIYWETVWKFWTNLVEDTRPNHADHGIYIDYQRASGVRFLQYLTIRRLVANELLHHNMENKPSADELRLFDEYLIRERHDWLWTHFDDVPAEMKKWLHYHPVHPRSKNAFKFDRKLFLPQMFAPPFDDGDFTPEWVWGSIPGLREALKAKVKDAVRFAKRKDLRAYAEEVMVNIDAEHPQCWHELMEPRIVFLSQEEDRQSKLPSLPPPVQGNQSTQRAAASPARSLHHDSLPSESLIHRKQHGVIDDDRFRALIKDFLLDVLTIPQLVTKITESLGVAFNSGAWSKLIDHATRLQEEGVSDVDWIIDTVFQAALTPAREPHDSGREREDVR